MALGSLLLGVLLVSSLYLLHTSAENVRFDGFSLRRLNVTTREQRALIEGLELDIWSHDGVLVEGLNDVMIPPNGMGVESLLTSAGLSLDEILISDVQELIDEQNTLRKIKSTMGLLDFHETYHDFEEIVFYLKELVDQHSSIATFIPSIGTSIEGRDLVGVWIHGGPASLRKRVAELKDIPDNVPKIFFTGGQHAREWVSPATVMYIIDQLLTRYGTDNEVTQILNKFGFLIVPVVNPDGYDYSWTNSRLWRKNRRRNGGILNSFGVDLNRNWDVEWGGSGSSHVPSSDTYCGTGPFSEPETTAVKNLVLSQKNIKLYIDWHAYGQLILRPYGYTRTPPPDEITLANLGALMKSTIKSVHNRDYTNEPSWTLYLTTGSSDDWCYVKGGVELSYTIELRDTGRYGFVLPDAEIIPTGQEGFAAAIRAISVLEP